MGDSDGFRRGAKGIDGNKTDGFKMPKSNCTYGYSDDYGDTAVNHKLSALIVDREAGYFGWAENKWFRPDGLPAGGPPRYAPKGDAGLQPVKACSPSGKYGKKGGSGQRSGE